MNWTKIYKILFSMAIISLIFMSGCIGGPPGHITPEMVLMKGGTYEMGGLDEDKAVKVTLTPFYIGKYEVKNEEYQKFNPDHKGTWPNFNYPVEQVSWNDAIEYCNWLSKREKLDPCYTGSGNDIVLDMNKNGYRLPTEAEWEYACRSGTDTKYYWGDEMMGQYCWYDKNSENKVHPVGQKKGNRFDLCDMSGNVWEWCWDWYAPYENNFETDPIGPESGDTRVVRGGGWDLGANYCQSKYRNFLDPSYKYDDIGFRLARSNVE